MEATSDAAAHASSDASSPASRQTAAKGAGSPRGLLRIHAELPDEERQVCDELYVPMDTITEHAMLVSRGVRPMSLVQIWLGKDTEAVERVVRVLMRVAVEWRVLPFAVVDREHRAYHGFAAEPWVVELLKHAVDSKDAEPHRHNIIGLLLGYGPKAIQEHAQMCEPHVWRVGAR